MFRRRQQSGKHEALYVVGDSDSHKHFVAAGDSAQQDTAAYMSGATLVKSILILQETKAAGEGDTSSNGFEAKDM